MRSAGGDELRLLDATADATFEEVDTLLLEHAPVRQLGDGQRARLLWGLYGRLACDRDTHALPFSIGLLPACPACGGRQMSAWEATGEPAACTAPAPTHQAWSALSLEQKRAALALALASLG